MAYKHGVYTSEATTSIIPAVNADSCVPVVFGVAPEGSNVKTYGDTTRLSSLGPTAVKILDHDGNGIPWPGSTGKIVFKAAGSGSTVISSFDDSDLTFSSDGGFIAIRATFTIALSIDVAQSVVVTFGYEDAYLCRSWKQFKDAFPTAEAVYAGADSSLAGFARHWFKRAGAGACFFVPVDASDNALVEALELVPTLRARFGVNPTVLYVHDAFGEDMASGNFVFDNIAAPVLSVCNKNRLTGVFNLYDITKADIIGDILRSPRLIYVSPEKCTVGDEQVYSAAAFIGAMASTDAENGGFPYVSPSNKLALIDGVLDGDDDPAYITQEDANDEFNAKGIVTFLNNAKGWVVWGNNTSAYPANTDPKDRFISIRRTFDYIQNDFITYCAPRVDLPINRRQIDGVINGYNMRLQGLNGAGVVNSASIAFDDELNTAATLLNGEVHFRVLISPPPPMENISAVFEYDVEGFTASLA